MIDFILFKIRWRLERNDFFFNMNRNETKTDWLCWVCETNYFADNEWKMIYVVMLRGMRQILTCKFWLKPYKVRFIIMKIEKKNEQTNHFGKENCFSRLDLLLLEGVKKCYPCLEIRITFFRASMTSVNYVHQNKNLPSLLSV